MEQSQSAGLTSLVDDMVAAQDPTYFTVRSWIADS